MPDQIELSVASILGADGRIARRIKNYESRCGQLDMAHAVESALRDKRHLIVEAGTGTGKSFAYLVPAILHVTKNQIEQDDQVEEDEEDSVCRVVISTHTINLQEQLIAKDIPLLNAVVPREFSSVLAKGRSNYLSLRRLNLANQRAHGLFSSRTNMNSSIKSFVGRKRPAMAHEATSLSALDHGVGRGRKRLGELPWSQLRHIR